MVAYNLTPRKCIVCGETFKVVRGSPALVCRDCEKIKHYYLLCGTKLEPEWTTQITTNHKYTALTCPKCKAKLTIRDFRPRPSRQGTEITCVLTRSTKKR
jgi:Zn finger protein HypA/HybF involved in hydrogenase expression